MYRAFSLGSLLQCGLLTVALVLSLSGCAVRTPVHAPSIELEPLPEIDAGQTYRLQVDDLLEIKFWGIEELNQQVRIRPDGRISMPYVDDVVAAGLTPVDLDAQLVDLYSSELARPEITVIVAETGALVYVGGEVESEGPVALRGGLTMLQAIQSAGGFQDTARRHDILIIRRPPGAEPVARAVNIRSVLSGEEPGRDVRLQASDIIFVPKTKIANVNLFVQQYVNQIFPIQTISSAAAVQVTRDAISPAGTTTNN